MAASSSSSSISHDEEKRYDVFLSFRGEDTRNQFASYLHQALHEKQILTFMDHKLERGDEISPSLQKAIENSVIAIVILSENYATSTWCLEELEHILDCKKRDGQTVMPIFYDIDPSVVRKQMGSYEDAFHQLEERFKDNMEKVKRWRAALKAVADLSGFESRKFCPEKRLIQKIVKDVLSKLPKYSSRNMDRNKGRLFGIDEDIKQIESLLCLGSPDFRVIGIWGLGGSGKTTLASLIFQKFSQSHFQGRSYLPNIRQEYQNGRKDDLKKKLLRNLLNDETTVSMDTPNIASPVILDRLCRIKALIVLDDVDKPDQLEDLAESYQFARGSRIIVTTTNKQLIQKLDQIDKVKPDQIDKVIRIHKVKRLSDIESLKLFHLHAFGKSSHATDVETLSKSITSYANGNPLAVKVLGSSLCSKSEKEWKGALENLKRIPDQGILEVLRISYEGLDGPSQYTFLDIAHFLDQPFNREFAELLLEGGSFSAKMGISVLIDKSLIEVFHEDTTMLCMHDSIRQMGSLIEQTKLGTHTRLRDVNDVCQVLEKSTGTATVELLILDMSEVERDVEVNSAAFSEMYNLRILKIYGDNIGTNKRRLHIPKGLRPYRSNKLRYLQWDFYPLNTLPSNFAPKNLVVLILRHSNLKKLENYVVKFLSNLRKMDLSHSKLLTQISDLSQSQNLTSIDLEGCTNLFEILSSIQNLHKLSFLNLKDCTSLRDIEEISRRIRYPGLLNRLCPWSFTFFKRFVSGLVIHLPSFISSFIINPSLDHIPADLPRNIRGLDLSGTAIEVVPSSIGSLSYLIFFILRGCKGLKTLPTSICKLKCLLLLDLSECSNLKEFPEILEPMEFLSTLNLSGAGIRTLPESIENLPGLRVLCLSDCKDLEFLPETLFNINSLYWLVLDRCSKLESLPPVSIFRLKGISLEDCVALKLTPDFSLPTCNRSAREFLSGLETVTSGFYPLRFKTDKFDWIGAQGLNLADSNLDLNTHDYVINHSAALMFSCITSRLIDFLKKEASVDEKLLLRGEGDGIPREFRYQSLGSSLNVRLPLNWNNNRLMGVAFCIAFRVSESPDPNLSPGIAFEIDDVHDIFTELTENEVNSDRTMTLYSSKRVNGQNWISTRGENVREVSFRAWPTFRDRRISEFVSLESENCRIIKCGMRLIYMDDLEEYAYGLNAFFKRATGSDFIQEEEDHDDQSLSRDDEDDEFPIPTGKISARKFLSAIQRDARKLYPLRFKTDKFDWIGAQGLNLEDSNLDLNTHDFVVNHSAFLVFSFILRALPGFQVAPIDERIPFCEKRGEIPKEFRYQSLGSSLNVTLPPNWNNNRLMGVAFCVVLRMGESTDPNVSVGIAYEIDYVRNKSACLTEYEINSDYMIYLYSSKHVNGRNWISTRPKDVTQVSFRARPWFYDRRISEYVALESDYCRIIKCGMWLVYMDDLEEYADGVDAFFKERICSHCLQEEEDRDDQSLSTDDEDDEFPIPTGKTNARQFLSAIEKIARKLYPLRFKTDKFDWIGAQGLNLADSNLDLNSRDYVVNHSAAVMFSCIVSRLMDFKVAPIGERNLFSRKGVEIPKGFTYQSLGSSLNVTLAPNWNNDRLVGVAFCIVLRWGESTDPNYSVGIAYEIDDVRDKFIRLTEYEINSDCVMTLYSSKHINGQNWISTHRNDVKVVSFRARPSFYDDRISKIVDLGSDSCRIIKCGMRLVYMDDLEEYADGVDALFKRVTGSDFVQEEEDHDDQSLSTGKKNARKFLSFVKSVESELYPLRFKTEKFDWIGAQGLNLADSKLDLYSSDYVINHSAALMLSCIVSRLKDLHVAPEDETEVFSPVGREIPKEFTYQSLGSSLNVTLPPNWNNDRLLGVAFCILLHARESTDPDFSFGIAYEIDNVRKKFFPLTEYEINSDRVITFYSSKHVNGKNWISTRGNDVREVSFRAWPSFHDDRISKIMDLGSVSSRIIKCGMRLVYMDDLEEYADGVDALFKGGFCPCCHLGEEDHDHQSLSTGISSKRRNEVVSEGDDDDAACEYFN